MSDAPSSPGSTAARSQAIAAASPVDPTHDALSAVQLSWALLSSATTTAVLGLLIALLLAFGAGIEQGAGLQELAAHHGFAVARAIHGLGLDDLATGWLPLLIMLLLVLNLLGLLLRYVFLARLQPTGEADLAGPLVSRAEGVLAIEPEEAEARLTRILAGARVHRRPHDGARVARRGAWDGGLVLLAFGALALGAALFVDRSGGVDARFTAVAGDAQRATTTEVRAAGAWMERPELPFACGAADPLDPWRRRDCLVPVDGGTQAVQLRAGASAQIGAVTFTPFRETPLPLPRDGKLRVVVRRSPGAPAELLEGVPGQTYKLPSGEQVTAHLGPDGPLVVARGADLGRPVLLTPALDRPVAPGPGGLWLQGVPAWQIEVRAHSRPERALVLAGLGLLALGFLAMGLLADVRATLVAVGDGQTRVVIRSVNRRDLPRRVLEQLVTGAGAA
jgi:hypothetical protein